MKWLQMAAVFCLLSGLGVSTLSAEQYTQFVAFGDSLTDVHNAYLLTGGATPPSPPYYDGRFSNGPVWLEIVAPRYGAPVPDCSVSEGTDYACGGSETGTPMVPPGMANQVAAYLAGNTPGGSELFVLWGGANDFFNGQTDPSVPVANLSGEITALAAAGATSFSVHNLPPLGQVPAFLGSDQQELLDNLTSAFNSLLSVELARLRSDLDVGIFELDVHAVFTDVIANPASYGLTNVTEPALDNGIVVPNPEEYLFWDLVHPTATGHLGIANAYPEPASIVLLATGGLGLIVLALRRRLPGLPV